MKRILPFVVLILSLYTSTAQTISPSVHPPSANAAALAGSIEIPVSNYTGVPNIEIPLITVHSGKIELPISISYNASGIRVAQEASSVGLGWSLNAGGMITRQMRGVDDIEGNGYNIIYNELPDRNYSLELPSAPYNIFWPGQCGYHQRYVYHDISLVTDGEPDIFYFSFLGYSGKFVLEKQSGTVIYGTTLDQSPIIIEFNRNTKNWTLTDDKGWVYTFSTKEYSRSGSRVVYPSNPEVSDEGPIIISSWYLDEITTPDNDEITFEYSSGQITDFVSSAKITEEKRLFMEHDFSVNGDWGFVRSDFSHTNSCVIEAENLCHDPGWVPYNLYFNPGYKMTEHWTQTSEVALQKIIFNEGYLIFSNSETRLDLSAGPVNPNVKGKMLDNIGVFNNKDENLKNFVFDYSYFNQDKINFNDKERYLRLKLDNLTEYASFDNGQLIANKPYVFSYWDPQLPAKDSYSIDNWGFYNGADNTLIQTYDFVNLLPNQSHTINNTPKPKLGTMLPMYIYVGAGQDKTKIFINGANRIPNEGYIKAGMLKEIKYPTGGHTHFEYECNDYTQIGQETYELQTPLEVNSDGVQQASFSLDNPSFILIKFELINHNYQNDPNAVGIMDSMTAKLTKDDGTLILKFIPETPSGSSNNNTPYMSAYICCALDPGSYKLNVNNGGYVYLDLSLSAQTLKKTFPEKIKAGGVRIKSITDYEDSQKITSIDNYKYENTDGSSSGRLLTRLVNYYNESNLIQINLGAQPLPPINTSIFHLDVNSISTLQNFVVGTSSSSIPLGSSAQGLTIGYSRVIEQKLNPNNTINFSREFQYRNLNDDYYLFFFPDAPNLIHNENGQLLKQFDLNADGQIVHSREFTYYPASTKKIPALRKIYGDTWGYENGLLDTWAPILLARFYDVKSEWWHISNINEVTYDEHGSNPVSNNTEYKFDNEVHKQPTHIIKSFYEGTIKQTLDEHYFYPYDFVNNIPSINLLKEKHIISRPIRVDKVKNGNLIEGKIIEYNDFGEPKYNYLYENSELTPPDIPNGIYTIPETFHMDKYFQYDDISKKIVLLSDQSGYSEMYIWDNEFHNLISIINNCNNPSGYSGFENNETNSFEKTDGATVINSDKFTGFSSLRVDPNRTGVSKVFSVGHQGLKHSGYIASVWAKGLGAFLHIEVNGDWGTHQRAEITADLNDGKWHLLKVELPRAYYLGNNGLQVKVYTGAAGSIAYFDDLRFHPMDAQMTSYTYKPLVGISSSSDANNKPTYFEYDLFGRLILVRNFEGDILKKYDYHYRPQ